MSDAKDLKQLQLMYSSWDCKLIQLLWKLSVSTEDTLRIPHDSKILLLGICQTEMCEYACIFMCIKILEKCL